MPSFCRRSCALIIPTTDFFLVDITSQSRLIISHLFRWTKITYAVVLSAEKSGVSLAPPRVFTNKQTNKQVFFEKFFCSTGGFLRVTDALCSFRAWIARWPRKGVLLKSGIGSKSCCPSQSATPSARSDPFASQTSCQRNASLGRRRNGPPQQQQPHLINTTTVLRQHHHRQQQRLRNRSVPKRSEIST